MGRSKMTIASSTSTHRRNVMDTTPWEVTKSLFQMDEPSLSHTPQQRMDTLLRFLMKVKQNTQKTLHITPLPQPLCTTLHLYIQHQCQHLHQHQNQPLYQHLPLYQHQLLLNPKLWKNPKNLLP